MSDISFMGENGILLPINNLGMYSDSTTMVKTELFAQIVLDAHTVLLRPHTLASLLAGLSVVDGVREHGGKIRTLILPYIPGARQDRANPTGDVGFMLQTVANLINSYKFERVLVADPHSVVALRKIKNSEEYPLSHIYELLGTDYDAVIAPDKGASMRASVASGVISREQFKETDTGKGIVFAEKHRDPATGKLSGFAVDVEEGKHYLVVDDICDGGGTFVGLGEKIKEQGATADLYVTHGIFSKGTSELKKFYQTIYTTDTRDINERNDVVIIPIVEGMVRFSCAI